MSNIYSHVIGEGTDVDDGMGFALLNLSWEDGIEMQLGLDPG